MSFIKAAETQHRAQPEGRDLTALATAAAVAGGSLEPRRHLRELQQLSGQLAGYDAVIPPLPALPSTMLPGHLNGVPVMVKDNIDVAGAPTTAGTPALANNIAERNAPLIDRLTRAGAVITGKNVMHELALGATSDNPVHGFPKNPWDPGRICGGSSGGTAAAVALGLAPVGIGTDTGGSVRMPAALCGLFGFRPSPGRYPDGGILSLTPTRDTAGPMTRTLQDLLLVDSVLASRPAVSAHIDQSVRIGISPCHRVDLHPDVAEKYRQVQAALAANGARFVDVDIDSIVKDAAEIATVILWGEAADGLEHYLRTHNGPTLQELVQTIASVDVRQLLVAGLSSVDRAEYQAALQTRQRLREELQRRLDAFNVKALMFPTVPVVAPLAEQSEWMELNGKVVPTFPTLIRHSDLGGILGLPGISVPVGTGTLSHLPVGMEFSSLSGTDNDLLALVAAIEPGIAQVTPPSKIPMS
ncbi:amidase family protein [Paenarthrobacter nitroguajacolicus]|uniref:amidase family protein n=1 Tax=Paenarthrobacter nitroguajacolicus TaxID=211146 RepID=UPI0028645AC8|nr:amidase family protein [Paenarthrobacter nitroguajacolicus]MDR6639516.1 mandelamide amidase [Paenarthrobacter nitroguajacolicus]